MDKKQKEQISKRMKEYRKEHPMVFTEEIRKKMGKNHKGMLGKHHSEKSKRKISEIKKTNYHPFRGKHRSEETKKKISEGVKRFRKNNPTFQKGENHPCFGKHKSHMEESIIKIRNARLKQIFPIKDSSIEVALQKALKSRGIEFQTHKLLLEKYQVDVFIPPSLIVEADGNYWHNYPDGRKEDELRDMELTNAGYTVVRFWGSEIRENINECIKTIEGLHILEGRWDSWL